MKNCKPITQSNMSDFFERGTNLYDDKLAILLLVKNKYIVLFDHMNIAKTLKSLNNQIQYLVSVNYKNAHLVYPRMKPIITKQIVVQLIQYLHIYFKDGISPSEGFVLNMPNTTFYNSDHQIPSQQNIYITMDIINYIAPTIANLYTFDCLFISSDTVKTLYDLFFV